MIGILDTASHSNNLGDRIIMNACETVFEELGIWPRLSLATHKSWSLSEIKNATQAKYWILCGTNALNSHHFFKFRSQWRLNLVHAAALRQKVIGLGLGWWQYQPKIDAPTAALYKFIFKRDFTHSMREKYSVDKFSQIGLFSDNTSCPTLWNVGNEFESRTDGIIFSLTYYRKNYKRDLHLYKLLKGYYGRVIFFAQSSEDLIYLKKLDIRPDLVLTTINEFQQYLSIGYGYCGTRLHAGIFALQSGRDAHIVAVDNRSVELSRDSNLSLIEEKDLFQNHFDFMKVKTKIRLPIQTIQKFKDDLVSLK